MDLVKTFVLLSLISLGVVSCSTKNLFKSNKMMNQGKGGQEISLNIDAKKYTLENGLRVIIHENHKLPIYSYYTFFDVGGRFETQGLYGGTHFLEHMMFKGAKKFGPGMMDPVIEGNGGSSNAYTTSDLTVYYEHLPSGTIEQIIDLESDRMQNLLLEPKDFEIEKKVVLDERLRNYDSDPNSWLFLKMMENVFEKTPYARSVIGEVSDITNLKREDVYKYFKENYAPNNAVIVISGDVDSGKVISKIKEFYGPILPSQEIKDYKEKLNQEKLYTHQGRYGRDIELHGVNPYPIYLLAYKGERLGAKRAFIMDILSSVMGNGESSYLSLRFVNSKGPDLLNIAASNYTLNKSGVFFIKGELLPGVSLKKHKGRLLKDIKNFCRDQEFDFERAVKKVKNLYLYQTINQLKTNEGLAHFLGRYEITYQDYQYYKKEMEIYNSITASDVIKACHELFSQDEYIFISIWKNYPDLPDKKTR